MYDGKHKISKNPEITNGPAKNMGEE